MCAMFINEVLGNKIPGILNFVDRIVTGRGRVPVVKVPVTCNMNISSPGISASKYFE